MSKCKCTPWQRGTKMLSCSPYRFFGAFPPGAFLPTFFPPVAFLATPFPPVVIIFFAGAFPPVEALPFDSLPFLGLLAGGTATTSRSESPLESSSTGIGSLVDEPPPAPAFRIEDRRAGAGIGDEAEGSLGVLTLGFAGVEACGAAEEETESDRIEVEAEYSNVALCFAAIGSPVRPSPRLRSAGYNSHSPCWGGRPSRFSCGLNNAMEMDDVSRIG